MKVAVISKSVKVCPGVNLPINRIVNVGSPEIVVGSPEIVVRSLQMVNDGVVDSC